MAMRVMGPQATCPSACEARPRDPRAAPGVLTTVAPMQAAEPDPALLDACGDKPTAVCRWTFERTGNEVLSTLVDWLIGRPLEALLILLVAWVASRVARRMIRRAIFRVVVADRNAATHALDRMVPPQRVSVEDPRRTARTTSIATVVASTASVAIWVVGILLALGQLGLD